MARKRVKRNIMREALQYIGESKRYIYIAIALFLVSAVIGFVFPGQFSFFDPILAELGSEIIGKSAGELTWFIFQNNVTSAFLAMILGVLAGVFPVINALSNGAVLGYVYSRASAIEGLGIIWLLVPHGIFELPAIFLSIGLGIRLGMFLFADNKKETFYTNLKGSLKAFLLVILPLLILAAIIEGVLIAAGSA